MSRSPRSEEKEEKSSPQPIKILSEKDFDQLTAEIDTLSVEGLLQRFEPFEIGRHFRRNCEINYYWKLSHRVIALYHEKTLMLSSTEEAILLQNLCFSHIQKGEHKKALDFFIRAENLKDKINVADLPLFQARQAQTRGPMLRDSGQPETAQQSIDMLMEGLVYCKQVSNLSKRYLAEANILRDLALGYLKQQDYQNAQKYFQIGLDSATQGGMSLFSFAMENYLALATARLGMKIENEGNPQKGRSLFESAVKQFNEVTEKYLIYNEEYQQQHGDPMLPDCQDYASHTFHKGLAQCEGKEFKGAIPSLLIALQLRQDLNLKGQLSNRVAEVMEWLAKAYLGANELKEAWHYANEAQTIYQHGLPQPDVGGIARTDTILTNILEIRSRISLFAALPMGNPWNEQEDAASPELAH